MSQIPPTSRPPLNAAGLPRKAPKVYHPRVPVDGKWRCSKCLQYLPRGAFTENRTWGKPSSQCKACIRAKYPAKNRFLVGGGYGTADMDGEYFERMLRLRKLAMVTSKSFKHHMNQALDEYLERHADQVPPDLSFGELL